MSATVWFNQGLSTQRDMIRMVREDMPDISVVASHSGKRPDIFEFSTSSFIEPGSDWFATNSYAEWALDRTVSGNYAAIVAMRNRCELLGARALFDAASVRIAAGAMDADTIELCEQKDLFTARMMQIGVPVPETIRVDTPFELAAAIGAIGLERGVCAKPVQGIYGQGYWRFRSGADLFAVFAGKEAHTIDPDIYIHAYGQAETQIPLIVMEHLPGVEHSIDCVCDNGRVVAHAKRRKSGPFQMISTGGPEFEIAETIVANLKLDGLINVQTRENAAGEPVVLEVNTRPSGGAVYAKAAGIDLPAILVRTLLDRPITLVEVREPISVRITEVPTHVQEIPSSIED